MKYAFEKVNPCHPDKVADRIAGAIVDLAYSKEENPKIAVEVLIGHGRCYIIAETSVHFETEEIEKIVQRIAGERIQTIYNENKQDEILARNQKERIRCGDNGIFKGVPYNDTEEELSELAKIIFDKYPSDGKYILEGKRLIVCQSNAQEKELREYISHFFSGEMIINPLGYWTGGTDADTGATNRKLGSDMGRAITGGGLHGKDISKADVSVNIYVHLIANQKQKEIRASCAIGDEFIDIDGEKVSFEEITKTAKEYISILGGFEKFAEWGFYISNVGEITIDD
jgi:S-adenosylmethionine synthetase